jgi:hypothetical protein
MKLQFFSQNIIRTMKLTSKLILLKTQELLLRYISNKKREQLTNLLSDFTDPHKKNTFKNQLF